MPTTRGFRRKAFQCGLYEAQDVLTEIDDVELLWLKPRPFFSLTESWQRRLLYRDVTRMLAFANPGLESVRVTQDYDLFVAVCQNYWDLLAINAIDGWKDRCRTSVCWLDELWLWQLPGAEYWLHALSQFDHVFIGCAGTVDALSKILGKRCDWIGGGADAIRFSPYPDPPARVIDAYRIGRTTEGVHRALTTAAARDGMFYLHDTVQGSDMEPFDHREHRSMIANLAKRSRYFIVAPGKVDVPGETRGQEEIGYRYYEGAAAGAVLIGQAPDTPSYSVRFGWSDALIPARPDGSDLADLIRSLDAQPDRLNDISRRNAVESLLQHDWLHRWKPILAAAGLPPSPRLVAREQRLQGLARVALDHEPRAVSA